MHPDETAAAAPGGPRVVAVAAARDGSTGLSSPRRDAAHTRAGEKQVMGVAAAECHSSKSQASAFGRRTLEKTQVMRV